MLRKKKSSALTVSAVTVTQVHRWELFGKNLLHVVKEQTALSSIIEWVVLVHHDADSPPSPEWLQDVEATIRKETGIPVVQMEACGRDRFPGIADCRERYNALACGDIIMVFDDDDYYPPKRVEAGLKLFRSQSRIQVAGCPDHNFYDTDLDIYGRMKVVDTPNRCTNFTMMYRRTYALANHYQAGQTFGEEKVFLRDFQEPLGRLDPDVAGVQIFHGLNTFNKRRLVFTQNGATWLAVRSKLIPFSNQFQIKPCLDSFQDNHTFPDPSTYDIVYYCGFQPEHLRWLPSDENLTGSEQAVIQITKRWAAEGKRVCVFADIRGNRVPYEGVDYFNSSMFTIRERAFKFLVMWRMIGFSPLWLQFRHQIKAQRCILDLHDNIQIPQAYTHDYTFHDNDYILVKSNYHRQFAIPTQQMQEKTRVIPNGLDLERIHKTGITSGRDMFRFIYTSDYQRGLVPILQYIWPHIRAKEPRAELHLYYGTNSIHDRETLLSLARAIYNSCGVCDHGRVSMDVVTEARKKSGWHLYTTFTTAETDCLSIKESWVAGCRPVTLNHGLFAERPGFKIPIEEGETSIGATNGERIATQILEMMKNLPEFDEHHVHDWTEIANMWLETIFTTA